MRRTEKREEESECETKRVGAVQGRTRISSERIVQMCHQVLSPIKDGVMLQSPQF